MVDKAIAGEETGRYPCIHAGRETTSTEEIVVRFGFTATTAKRYMRQLTEYGHLEALGGNRNRTYRVRHQK